MLARSGLQSGCFDQRSASARSITGTAASNAAGNGHLGQLTSGNAPTGPTIRVAGFSVQVTRRAFLKTYADLTKEISFAGEQHSLAVRILDFSTKMSCYRGMFCLAETRRQSKTLSCELLPHREHTSDAA